MAAAFEVYMLAVSLLALKTALDAGGPWYGPEETRWVYATTFVGGLILVSVLLLAALRLIRAKQPEYVYPTAPLQNPATASQRRALDDQDFEGLLESLEEVAGGSTNPKGAAGGILEKDRVRSPSAAKPSVRRHAPRALVAVLGPAVGAAVFAGIGAILLPASAGGGFLAGNFLLNTTFILALSYGWAALIPYAIACVFLAASEA